MQTIEERRPKVSAEEKRKERARKRWECCKNDPLLRQGRAERLKQWRAANKDDQNRKARERYRLDPAYRAKRLAQHRQPNPDTLRKWRLSHPELVAAYKKKFRTKESIEVTDAYVRHLLSSHGSSIPMSDWPQELVDLKRVQVQLKRKVQA